MWRCKISAEGADHLRNKCSQSR